MKEKVPKQVRRLIERDKEIAKAAKALTRQRKFSLRKQGDQKDELLKGLMWCYYHMEFAYRCSQNDCSGCESDVSCGLLPELDRLIKLRQAELKSCRA